MLSRRFTPSLTALIAFECVARHGSFTRAAEELSLTQGALSKQVRQLEDVLQVSLFERNRRQVQVKASCRGYLMEVRSILRKVDRATSTAIRINATPSRLRCAVQWAFLEEWLVGRLPAFAAQHPDVMLEFSSFSDPFDLLEAGLDAAICAGKFGWPDCVQLPMADHSFAVVASPEYLWRSDIKRPADLLACTLIQCSSNATAWPAWFESNRLSPPPAASPLIFSDYAAVVEAAARGLGIALVPERSASFHLRDGTLMQPFATWAAPDRLHLVIPRARAEDVIVRAFTSCLTEDSSEIDVISP